MLLIGALQPQPWVAALFWEGEYRGLSVETIPEGNSCKFHAQPLGHQTADQWLPVAPWCNDSHRKGFFGHQTQQLYQGVNQRLIFSMNQRVFSSDKFQELLMA
ncbi:MAG: hypothetical protein HO274_02385 [Ferrovum myxofaciens]|uniref:hypothetical protein n=1 Tax=Ferrovum myxofaciens TaxID=416213 RepID=UPI002354C4ED|nr:hypothetical protein [Ferrovum myxofaciens]QKE40305.1 MAG: hypothetical protein HO274_02385 [Ferrovum myxofaciens]